MDSDKKNNNNKHTAQERRYVQEARALTEANKGLTNKLTIASAFTSMWIKAYDALRHHSVDMRELPEYSDHAALDRALEVGVENVEGSGRVMAYITRVCNGIDAAVRRKGFRKV